MEFNKKESHIFVWLFLTLFLIIICYDNYGDKMKVKIFDENHEHDLEIKINNFLKEKKEEDIIDIKYQVSSFYDNRTQIYCFSAMIIYKN